MFRFYTLVTISIPLILYYVLLADYYYNHEDRYDEDACYKLVLRIINSVKKLGRIRTVVLDDDKLPKEGGYIMYSNHQGKFDALGIMEAHKTPCSVVADAERSKMLLFNQVIKLVRGKRLERHNLKQQVAELDKLTEEVKNGRRYIYFPEGGYDHNGNKLQEFRAGAFKCAVKAKATIVPVAIYDSHLPFDFNSYRKVTTQVCFLDPIYYDEYAGKTTREIGEMIKGRIEEKLVLLEENRAKNGYNKKFKIYRTAQKTG